MEHPLAALVRQLYDARARHDEATIRALLAPDVVWHEPPGAAAYTGDHIGPDAVRRNMIGAAMAVTAGTFRLELDDAIPHGEHVVALVRWSATRHGRTMTGHEVGVYRITNNRVADAWFFPNDPAAVDAFFA